MNTEGINGMNHTSISTPLLIPVVPNYRTSLPPLWPHVYPLCNWSTRARMRVISGSSIHVINPRVLEDVLRRRFHRGARTSGNLMVHWNDWRSIQAFQDSCNYHANEYGETKPRVAPVRLEVNNPYGRVKEVIDCLRELVGMLNTTEIIDILTQHVCEVPDVDRVSFVNYLLSLPR